MAFEEQQETTYCVPGVSPPYFAGDILHFPEGRCLHRNLLACRSWDFGRPDSSDAVEGSFGSPSHQLTHDAAPTGFWAGRAFFRPDPAKRPRTMAPGKGSAFPPGATDGILKSLLENNRGECILPRQELGCFRSSKLLSNNFIWKTSGPGWSALASARTAPRPPLPLVYPRQTCIVPTAAGGNRSLVYFAFCSPL